MKVVVTGGSGFLGRHLVEALLARGDEVLSIVRTVDESMNDVEQVTWTGDPDEIESRISAFAPDAAVHLAALSLSDHRPEDIAPMVAASLVLGTQLMDALSRTSCRGLVTADTFWQHGPASPFGTDVAPSNLYAALKSSLDPVAEFYWAHRGLSRVSLELFDIYGPSDSRSRFVESVVALDPQSALDVSPGLQIIDLVHVSDAVGAFLVAVDAVADGSLRGTPRFSVSGGHRRSLRDVVALIESVRGVTLDLRWGARPYRDCDVLIPCSDCPPLPGWSPAITLPDGIRSMVAANRPIR